MEILSVLGFAIALSFDGFGAGIAYGIRRIRIPIHCLILISLTSCVILALSMTCGHIIARYVNNYLATWFGAIILIVVGVWTIYQTWQHRNDTDPEKVAGMESSPGCQHKVLELKLAPLGCVIQILREPVKADIDESGVLSEQESLLLGVALAMDALGAGFGLAMSGFKPWIAPFVVGLVKFIMVRSGVYLGKTFAAGSLGKKMAILPGWILIAIGISRILKI